MKKLLILLLISYILHPASAQVSINTTNTAANSSSMLDITSSNKGLLIPRMTSAQRSAIASPAKGLMVYDSISSTIWYYDKVWKEMPTVATTDSSFILKQNALPSFNMGTNTNSADSSGYIYDSGGPGGNYSNNENLDFTIFTPDGTQQSRIQIISLNTESPYDSLRIYQGSRSYNFSGNVSNQILYFDNSDYIYLNFKSNNANSQAGYQIRFDHYFLPSSSTTNLSTVFTGFYYIPEKMAMCGGFQTNNNWNKDSVGFSSFSYGYGTQAKGRRSTAMGYYTTASGYASTTFGRYTTGSGYASTAMGLNTIASGVYSSTAMGYNTTASGNYSTATGYRTIASGLTTFTIGGDTKAQGTNSFASGDNSISKGYAGTVVGLYNDSLLAYSEVAISPTTPLFIVGNGDADNTRSNALVVVKNGRVFIDPSNKNSGDLTNALSFGSYNGTGEGIASKRSAGGNQYGLDFYTNYSTKMSITLAGQVQVANNLTVQNGKGMIRNTDGTQSKKLSTTVTINATFSAGETKTYTVTWPESFSSAPEAFVGNVVSGSGGWGEAVMTLFNTTTTGATLYVYNPRSSSATPNFTIKIIAIGAQ